MRAPSIGTAGWSISSHIAHFPSDGTHLMRYAGRLDAVEINSSFYRPHRKATYEKWAASVPDAFRFSVKLPKVITHEAGLDAPDDMIARFAEEVAGLGSKLDVVLVQLPPRLRFDRKVAEAAFARLHRSLGVPLVCEPRHASWFAADVDADLASWRVARVAADPAPAPGADVPGGWRGLTYFRLHGAPRIYYSPYDQDALAGIRSRIEACKGRVWCIFDNTAAGAALGHALTLTLPS